MKILIVGAGGREHALAWKLLKNEKVEKIFIAPGNAGSELLSKAENIILENDITKYAQFAKENNIDLTVVGSEELLVAGIVDEFKKEGLKIFGPDKKAAILEGSKAYSKDFMKKYGIRTAAYEIFEDAEKAKIFLTNWKDFPVVVKASGLAAGKGVIIAQSLEEALKAVEDIMVDSKFGSAGNKVVIEEFLDGVEASILSFTDGKVIVPLLSAKDHKKIGENETGLNTGGMGVISPNPYVCDETLEQFKKDIMEPTLKGMKSEGMDFEGVIFFGLMITEKGVYLLEYNSHYASSLLRISIYASSIPPRSCLNLSLSSFLPVALSHSLHVSGVISSASSISPLLFFPNSILKSTRVIPSSSNMFFSKSFILEVVAYISSSSSNVASPIATA